MGRQLGIADDLHRLGGAAGRDGAVAGREGGRPGGHRDEAQLTEAHHKVLK